MNCYACNTGISSDLHMQCSRCNVKYHLPCLTISKEQFLALSTEFKQAWACPSCNNVTRRTRCNLNTPVKQSQIPSATYDYSDHGMPAGLDESMHSITEPAGNDTVTMEKISQLLDQKLQSSLSIFMNDFRTALKEDVKFLVREEMKSTVQGLKDDFNSTISFMSEEQTSLRSQINAKNDTIKNLEAQNAKLQNEMYKLNSRLSDFEKISRSNNIELQAVPESRNENVISLFKKLCDTINVSIEDSNIHACRRVAKMDAKSNRPRNILISLSSPRLRDSVLSSISRYNKAHPKDPLSSIHLGIAGETRRIYASEHLSPECKLLYAQTRKAAKEKNYKYVWVRYGRIYVRRNDESGYILIRDAFSLEKL